jgi:hypothetical protein
MHGLRFIAIDLEIDKLTKSIENVITGDSFSTEVLPFSFPDAAYKKTHWRFDWLEEVSRSEGTVYKLVIRDSPKVIQGLICMVDNDDHVLVHLIESAKFNQGKDKMYVGVPGNLFAFACKTSFDLGYDGFVAFNAKAKLMNHYMQSLGAKRLFDTKLVLDTIAARNLVSKYFKD